MSESDHFFLSSLSPAAAWCSTAVVQSYRTAILETRRRRITGLIFSAKGGPRNPITKHRQWFAMFYGAAWSDRPDRPDRPSLALAFAAIGPTRQICPPCSSLSCADLVGLCMRHGASRRVCVAYSRFARSTPGRPSRSHAVQMSMPRFFRTRASRACRTCMSSLTF